MKKIIFDFENIGGLAEIYAIPPTSFRRIRNDYNTGLKYLEVKNRDDIIVIPMFADDTFIYNEDSDYEDGGLIYTIDIEGIIPKIANDNADILQTLDNKYWYVLCRDNNNVVHFCGTEDVGLIFKSKKTTGTAVTERNGISFTFTNKQSVPSIIVELDDLSDI